MKTMKKNRSKIRKHLFVDILLFFLSIFTIRAQIVTVTQYDLSKIIPNWVAVLGGNVLCEPVRTSYGFTVISEGRMLSAFTTNGTVLWQKSFSKNIRPFLSAGFSDMLFVISGSSTLNMLNSGGKVVWSDDVGFDISGPVFQGKDGRIFVTGANKLACYGLSGIRRWCIDTDAQDSNNLPEELNDGSLLVFLAKTEGGKSTASHVTPFGTTTETIIFSGKVQRAVSCSDGVLLTFTDGSAGLCTVDKGTAVSKWVVSSGTQGITSPTYVSSTGFADGIALLVSGSPALVSIINTATGTSIHSYQTSSINAGTITFAACIPQGILVADNKKAVCCRSNGTAIWEAKLSPQKDWTYLFPTDNGYLALCGTNWVIQAYRTSQSVGSAQISTFAEKRIGSYSAYYSKTMRTSSAILGRAISPEESNLMYASFCKGDFAQNEADWMPVLENEFMQMESSWNVAQTKDHLAEEPYFNTHLDYVEDLLNLAGVSGTACFQGYISRMMKKVTDPSLQQCLIKTAGIIAFDSDGSMLASLESVVHSISPRNQNTLKLVCDSVYSICSYMGRPAYFEYGQRILTGMLYPQYDAKVRDYARDTLKKIAELKL